MMNPDAFFTSLPRLQAKVLQWAEGADDLLRKAEAQNPWFTSSFSAAALQAIAEDYLDEVKCRAWRDRYPVEAQASRRIGLIPAGNLPLVGFHDLLSVLAAGHTAVIRMSEKDNVLLPALLEAWGRVWPGLAARVEIVDRIGAIDAVIATGTDTAARHFDYYFRQYPRLLRGHRNGIALLQGNETPAEMEALMADIFLYFGLGCRNVSALLVPAGYDFADWFSYVQPWAHLADHHKYRHNLDYNLAIFMINSLPHLQLGALILRPDAGIVSRIGCVHFRTYTDSGEAIDLLSADRTRIQCVVSRAPMEGWDWVPFGRSQRPQLDQYADGEDTMAFLTGLP